METTNRLHDTALHLDPLRHGAGLQNGTDFAHGGPGATRIGVQSRHGALSTWLRNRFGLNTHLNGRSSGAASLTTVTHAVQPGTAPPTRQGASVLPPGSRTASWNDLPTEIVATIFEDVIAVADKPTAVRQLRQLGNIDRRARVVSREIVASNRVLVFAKPRELAESKKEFAKLSQRTDMNNATFAAEFRKLVNKYRHLDIEISDFRGVGRHQMMLDILSESTHLRALHLNASKAFKEDDIIIATAMVIGANNPHLSEFHLDMEGRSLGPEKADALAAIPRLTSLNVRNNDMGFLGAVALADSPSLTSLNISKNGIGDAGAQILARNTLFTRLDVSDNDIDITGIQALAENLSITSLNVSKNRIGDNGAQALAANPRFIALNASSCGIGFTGAEALADSHSIISLNLSENAIHNIGARALAANPRFIELNVSSCSIGVDGAQALAGSPSITRLLLAHNRIGLVGARSIAGNPILVLLDASFNELRASSAKALANSPSIVVLDMRHNKIGYFGAKALVKNTRFTSLDVRNNGIPGLAKRALSRIAAITIRDLRIYFDQGP